MAGAAVVPLPLKAGVEPIGAQTVLVHYQQPNFCYF